MENREEKKNKLAIFDIVLYSFPFLGQASVLLTTSKETNQSVFCPWEARGLSCFHIL